MLDASVRKSIFPLESSAAGPSAVGADIDQLDENREEFVESLSTLTGPGRVPESCPLNGLSGSTINRK